MTRIKHIRRSSDALVMLKSADCRRAVSLLLTLAVGAALIWWTVQVTEERMRAEMLVEARTAAHAINVERVLSLSGSEEDLSMPNYGRLKEQLARMRQASPRCRFLYLMGRRADGTFFSFVDSRPPGSEDYAPPGLVYADEIHPEEVPEPYLQAFDAGQEVVVGPVTDRWGTLVVALVPLSDPQTGKPVAVLGMDVEASDWNWELIRQCLVPFTATLVVVLLILALAAQRQQVRARRESEERWRSLTETSPDHILTLDADLNIQFANYASPGLTVEELVGTPPYTYAEEERQAEIKATLERVLRTGDDASYEMIYHTPDGTVINYESRVTPRRLPGSDEIVGLTLSARDITERKQAHQALRRSEERFRYLVSESPAVIFSYRIHEEALEITFLSQNVEDILGYPPERFVGDIDFWMSRVHPDDVPHVMKGVASLLEKGRLVYEYRFRDKAGRYHWLRDEQRLINPDEDAPEVIGSWFDITKRRRAEEEQEHLLVMEREQRLLAETLRDVTLALTAQISHEAVLDEILRQTQRIVPHSTANIALLEDDVLHLVRWQGYEAFNDETFIANLEQPLADLPLNTESVQSQKPIAVSDTHQEPRWVTYDQTAWIRSCLIIPICLRDRVLGLLRLDGDTPDQFSDEDAQRLQPLANAAAIAIENASLYETEAQQRQEAEMLRETALALTTSLDRDQVIERILIQLQQVVSYDTASVQLLRGDHLEVVGGHGFPDLQGVLGISFPADGDNPNSEVVRTRAPLILEDPPVAYGTFRHIARARHIRSWLGVPMQVGERLVGMISLDKTVPGFYTQEHARLAEAFAAQAAVAFENARLFDEITERRVYLEGVLGAAPDAIVTQDARYRIVEWNPGAEKLFGYSREEAIGQSIDDLITAPDVLEEAAGLTQVVSNGKDLPPVEAVRYRKDGSAVDVLVAGSPIMIEDKLIGVVGVYTDITEHKRMEQQLRQQERLAAVGQLAAGIAHDFRNLLTSVILYASMALRRPDLPPTLAPDIETIIDESKKAAGLVQQILDFSSRAMIERRPLDLASFTGEVLDVLRRTIPENVRLSLEARQEEQGTALTVRADPGRIQQALTNLAINARDAMPHGGELRFELSRVEVAAGETPPVADMGPGAWVCLAVSDTGTGMTEEVRAHLFEPFFTTKEVNQGTGLGLAQVYGIVRQHKGYIDAETEPGRGTTFCIYLPADRASVKETEAEEPSTLPQGQGETILLVEDNKALREAAQGILESQGYRVLSAANGREALKVYEAEGADIDPYRLRSAASGVDLVITDMVMPEMDGRELMRELRRSDPSLKALGITGYAVEKAADEELQAIGFLDVIHKPFEVKELARAIRRALQKGGCQEPRWKEK